MNKQQVKGTVKEAAGKVQKDFGKVTSNGTQEAKGKAREMAGKAEKAYGDAKSAAGKGARDMDRQSSR